MTEVDGHLQWAAYSVSQIGSSCQLYNRELGISCRLDGEPITH